MNIKSLLFPIVQDLQTKEDPSHDIHHILRVTNLAEKIGTEENADMEVLIPAALFHDIIVYRKDSPQSRNETEESAEKAGEILATIPDYPKEKIEMVKTCIRQCSFSKGIVPDLLEAKILQDADKLESTGAISIMRTLSSGGQMNRAFYDPEDPFRNRTDPMPPPSGYSLDLFFRRLMIVGGMMHTQAAKKMAKHRTEFLTTFLNQLWVELEESGIIKV
jgi:uncharacterized protein